MKYILLILLTISTIVIIYYSIHKDAFLSLKNIDDSPDQKIITDQTTSKIETTLATTSNVISTSSNIIKESSSITDSSISSTEKDIRNEQTIDEKVVPSEETKGDTGNACQKVNDRVAFSQDNDCNPSDYFLLSERYHLGLILQIPEDTFTIYDNEGNILKPAADIHIYDGLDNHTGIVYDPKQVPYLLNDIPGSNIRTINHDINFSLQGDRPYRIQIDGNHYGTLSLEFEIYKGDDLIKKYFFSSIPTTPHLTGNIIINPNGVVGEMKLDYDNNNTFDSAILPTESKSEAYFKSIGALKDFIKTLDLDNEIKQELYFYTDNVIRAGTNQENVKQALNDFLEKVEATETKKINTEIKEALRGMIFDIFNIFMNI